MRHCGSEMCLYSKPVLLGVAHMYCCPSVSLSSIIQACNSTMESHKAGIQCESSFLAHIAGSAIYRSKSQRSKLLEHVKLRCKIALTLRNSYFKIIAGFIELFLTAWVINIEAFQGRKVNGLGNICMKCMSTDFQNKASIMFQLMNVATMPHEILKIIYQDERVCMLGRAGFRGVPGGPRAPGLPPNHSILLFFDWPVMTST